MTDDLQRLLAGDGRAYHLLDVIGVPNLQSIHANRLASFHSVCSKDVAARHKSGSEVGRKGRVGPPAPYLIFFAPGPGAILRSRIDSDFSLGSLVRTTFTGRPDPRSVTFAAGPSGGGIQRSPHCDRA